MALEKLIEYIGNEEESRGSFHSFDPQPWPENVYQAPLTEDEESYVKNANNREEAVRRIPKNRRYLPCHYFDFICGSSTGA